MTEADFDNLYIDLVSARDELRKKNPEHDLLGLLTIREGKITCEPGFDERYKGYSFRVEEVAQYVIDLQAAVD